MYPCPTEKYAGASPNLVLAYASAAAGEKDTRTPKSTEYFGLTKGQNYVQHSAIFQITSLPSAATVLMKPLPMFTKSVTAFSCLVNSLSDFFARS